jgi:hypothetical protein
MILSHESMRTMILRNVDGIYLKFSSANIPSEAMINTCLSFFSSGFPFFFLDEMLIWSPKSYVFCSFSVHKIYLWFRTTTVNLLICSTVFLFKSWLKTIFVFSQDHSAFFPVLKNVVFYLNRVILVALQWMGLRYCVQALKKLRRCINQNFC